MSEKDRGEKKGLMDWFMKFQKIEAVALIGLATLTGSASLWTAAIIDTTSGVIIDSELKKRKKKKNG